MFQDAARYTISSRARRRSFVLLWRKGSSVLTAGHLKITRDARFKIVGDYNLQINGVKTQDAGDYICQLGDQENRDQVHTVEILGINEISHCDSRNLNSNENILVLVLRSSKKKMTHFCILPRQIWRSNFNLKGKAVLENLYFIFW
ncbi:hypothetical protein FF38_11940 [Lucilia cuprina]|uniref:Ig-like domain-containing protein n=1 Tax=Lucilia cuprina TaxID=7375 RepID=A0A0L0BQL1_LUCCU|nr:hypothetical protein FF38_11940 [Lucilia cuprina]